MVAFSSSNLADSVDSKRSQIGVDEQMQLKTLHGDQADTTQESKPKNSMNHCEEK